MVKKRINLLLINEQSKRLLMQLKKIILYGEPQSKSLREEELKRYVEKKLSLPVGVRGEFFYYWLGKLSPQDREKKIEHLSRRLARIRVRDPYKPVDISYEPFKIEIDYESNNLTHPLTKKMGILYEGGMFVSILRELIDPVELTSEYLHIVVTNQLLATWGGGRYHVRTVVCAVPCVISTSGLVEGPAKPKEFYLLKQQYMNLGRENMLETLKEDFKGEFLDWDDERITDVIKGYLMQAVFYHLTGEPFCNDPNCRGYNAHWQKELLQAQLYSPYEFCTYHQRILSQVRCSAFKVQGINKIDQIKRNKRAQRDKPDE